MTEIITCPVCGQEIPPIATVQVEKYPDGSMKKWTETTMDSHGTALSKRVDEYTYKDGVVDQIAQQIYNEKDALIKNQIITHLPEFKITVEDVEIVAVVKEVI